MANFTVRVQLKGKPESDDYEDLHAGMAESGYSRTIKAGGKIYWLPHAEYSKASMKSAADIKDEVVRIAKEVYRGKDGASVFVTKADGPRTLDNLDEF